MAETPQQYTARILSYAARQDPRDVLARTPDALAELITTATADQLRHAPSPDRWSAGEVLAHLADAEIVLAWRYRSVLGRSGEPIQAYDQDVWASTFAYQQADPQESLDTLTAVRRANLRLLKSLEPSLLERYGLHQERGHETVEHIMRLHAGHDLNHLGQIERLLGRT